MPDVSIELEELLEAIREMWPQRYARGQILHVHQNARRLRSGGIAHVRILIQQIAEPTEEDRYGQNRR